MRQHERQVRGRYASDSRRHFEHRAQRVVGDGFGRCAVAGDAAPVEHDYAVGEQRREVEVVQDRETVAPRAAQRRATIRSTSS